MNNFFGCATINGVVPIFETVVHAVMSFTPEITKAFKFSNDQEFSLIILPVDECSCCL